MIIINLNERLRRIEHGKVFGRNRCRNDGARCALFDLKGNLLFSEYREYGATYPKPGWVEQDLDEMVASTMEACKATIVKSGIDPKEIVSIGFSTQRSVTVPVDKDGNKVRPMLSWQDARTGAEVGDLLKKIDGGEYYDISGMPPGTTWVITKVLWMRKNEPDLYEKTFKFVQNQDAVLKAFGADDFFTDTSDMAFYGVWDVGKVEWSKELCDKLDVSPEMFGKPTRPGTVVGKVTPSIAEKTGFAVGTLICVGAGDQNCGVVGMGSIKSGMATVTLGTAGLAILSLDKRIPGFGGLMITNHAVPGMWEMEGLSNAAASSYRWFRDVIGTQEKELEKANNRSAYEYLNDLAKQARWAAKACFTCLTWVRRPPRGRNANARSAFIGMSFAHGRSEMTRSVMEGVALEVRDMMDGWLQSRCRR